VEAATARYLRFGKLCAARVTVRKSLREEAEGAGAFGGVVRANAGLLRGVEVREGWC